VFHIQVNMVSELVLKGVRILISVFSLSQHCVVGYSFVFAPIHITGSGDQ
jgi:hypothetical protein